LRASIRLPVRTEVASESTSLQSDTRSSVCCAGGHTRPCLPQAFAPTMDKRLTGEKKIRPASITESRTATARKQCDYQTERSVLASEQVFPNAAVFGVAPACAKNIRILGISVN